MLFTIKDNEIAKKKNKSLIVGLFNNKQLTADAQQLDTVCGGLLTQLIKRGDINCALGEATLLYQVPNSKADVVIVIGAGDEALFDHRAAKKWLRALFSTMKKKMIAEAVLFYNTIKTTVVEAYQFGRMLPIIEKESNYQFNQFKSKTDTVSYQLKSCVLVTNDNDSNQELELGIRHGVAIADAITVTKDLANMPPNICNASYLAGQGQALAKRFAAIKTKVLGKNELAKLGMNAYLAVSEGSHNEPKLTVIEYKGAKSKSAKPIVLVGKGLTFDSGGISIKPSASMDEMKYDMCGAATVYGVMQAIADLKLTINVIGVMAGCENMPSGTAYRPGDILTTLSGQTVEVINTDAEGRLVLCDVLSYVERFKPEYVIDIATLTGACIIALGHHYTGLLANNAVLAKALLEAGKKSGDKAWQLPLDEDFQRQIDSPFADMANATSRDGGTITAGCFLSRFTKKYSWAHLDIAGTAWTSGSNKGATGRPVNLLMQFMLDNANK